LDEIGLKATFFVIGEHVEKYPSLVSDIKSRGHALGNHGYRHLAGWRISTKQFEENVIIGGQISESNLFRPPYGQIGWRQYQSIKKDHRIIMWSIMPGDFMRGINVSVKMKNVNALIGQGDIIVLHDNPLHIDQCLSMLRLLNFENISDWTTLS
jgi:peptidoglycan/xylan/chitin deacetylase (PgdA/CDA1 family)